MSDAETPDTGTPRPDPSSRRRARSVPVDADLPRGPRSGRLLASVALLVALAAAVFAAWPWYAHHLPGLELPPPALATAQPVHASAVLAADLEHALAAVQADAVRRITALEAALSATERRIRAQLEPLGAADAATSRQLAELELRLGTELRALASAAPDRAEWRLAEVEYLLRLARHRLAFDADASLAGRILAVADRLLVELDDPELLPVRARIAEDRAALAGAPRVDRDGLFLRLEALKPALEALPLRLPEFGTTRAASAEPDAREQGLGDEVLARLSRLFVVRRHDAEAARPLLAPDQATYLEMNLRLMLERAQLALVRSDQAVFRSSLQTARHWLLDHLDVRHPGVGHMLAELDALVQVELEAELPDISGGLTLLQGRRAQRMVGR
jgi:uroporphyrin-III C-methyltransferase